ncbi:hypothetical protein AMECASPLE_024131 [Ameca splendens]|uniref:Secreted protein n=1 Tax=Ameca splendens TaxID=208324 RepID=A0ABV0XHA9_9TELE
MILLFCLVISAPTWICLYNLLFSVSLAAEICHGAQTHATREPDCAGKDVATTCKISAFFFFNLPQICDDGITHCPASSSHDSLPYPAIENGASGPGPYK